MVFELLSKEEAALLPPVLDDFEEPFFIKKWPACHATIFCTSLKDGTYRQPGSLSVWRGPEGVTVKVTDNELDVAWQHTSETFEKALNQVEKLIAERKAPNRSNKSRGGPRARKK